MFYSLRKVKQLQAKKIIGKLKWPPNLPHINPLDAYLRNAKTVEVYKARSEPCTKIEHLKRRIKRLWQCAHGEVYILILTLSPTSEGSGGRYHWLAFCIVLLNCYVTILKRCIDCICHILELTSLSLLVETKFCI